MAEKSVTRYNHKDPLVQYEMRKCGKLSFEEGVRAALNLSEIQALVKSIKDSNDVIFGFTKDWETRGGQRMGIIQMQENKKALAKWDAFTGSGK
ncbi:hypothetical protein [Bdellovibrio sp. HCB288]|uniref:hypothetical protein n=1 Tax=Bdellovibrio sp. HCB288 TaxID=3394355 RepID=UPI0039B5D091